MTVQRTGDWLVQVPGWLLFAYLVYAQCLAAFDYELAVRLGTQEPASLITDVGAAFWWAFAFADLVVYVPLLALGLIGHLRNAAWGRVTLAAALGITVYWPVVALAAIVDAADAAGWSLPNQAAYWTILPLIVVWAAWALLHLVRTGDTGEAAGQPAGGEYGRREPSP